MTIEIVAAPFGSCMFDCLVPIEQSTLDALALTSYGYVLPGTRTGPAIFGRYLETLTVEEVARILNHPMHYGLLLIGESRPNGYIPSTEQGTEDGQREVSKRKALGLAAGGGIVWDGEGMGGTAEDVTYSANAYAEQLQHAGDQAIAYVGAGIPLSSVGLYALRQTLYWHSLSNVQPVAT